MRGARALEELLKPDGDPEDRFEALMLIAQAMQDLHILRLCLTGIG